MSMFNLSAVMAYTFTGRMLEIFDNDYSKAIYAGAALTLITVVFLIFIDPDECNRVLENEEEGEVLDADLGESSWWPDEEGGGDPIASA